MMVLDRSPIVNVAAYGLALAVTAQVSAESQIEATGRMLDG
jgi:hypothetical protein